MTAMTETTPSAAAAAAPAAAVGPIATFDLVVLDTPEPQALADFYCALLGWQVIRDDGDWVTIRGDSSAGIAFQLAPNLVPPTWPDPAVPQQFHLDVNVPDLDAAEQRVLAIGARLTGQPAEPSNFRAYLDPSGHPFCLCLVTD
jgi:predicted enzyme related to lactoylglutathione lyase